MKIAYLTPEFPHPKTGSAAGIGTSILNLSKGLLQLGHEVSILVYGQDTDEVFGDNGLTIYRIKNIKFKGLSLFLTQHKVKKLINVLHSENKVDIVEAPDWTGFTSFLKPKCPLVVKIHGSDTYFCHLDKRPVKAINKFLEKRAYLNADGIITVSKFAGELTNTVFDSDRDFSVIPNAIDYAQFEPSQSTDEKIILYFGTLIRKKGILELPAIFNEVFKKDKQAKLVLIGKDSPDKTSENPSTWQMSMALFDSEAFQNVAYLGSKPYLEMKNHIQKASLCIFPSFAEALPVSWLEAMSMEKPVVASDIGWANEIIDDGKDGFLVNPNEHTKFAAKIVTVLEDVNLQTKLGKAARKKVMEKFSVEIVAQQSVDFYQKMTKK